MNTAKLIPSFESVRKLLRVAAAALLCVTAIGAQAQYTWKAASAGSGGGGGGGGGGAAACGLTSQVLKAYAGVSVSTSNANGTYGQAWSTMTLSVNAAGTQATCSYEFGDLWWGGRDPSLLSSCSGNKSCSTNHVYNGQGSTVRGEFAASGLTCNGQGSDLLGIASSATLTLPGYSDDMVSGSYIDDNGSHPLPGGSVADKCAGPATDPYANDLFCAAHGGTRELACAQGFTYANCKDGVTLMTVLTCNPGNFNN